MLICNGNRTEYSPIQYAIIRVINKIGRPQSGSPISKSRVWLETELDDTNSYWQLIINIVLVNSKVVLRLCSNFRFLRLNRAKGETYRGNNQKINSAHILRLSRPWCETNHDKLRFAEYRFIYEKFDNIRIPSKLRRISSFFVTKSNNLDR